MVKSCSQLSSLKLQSEFCRSYVFELASESARHIKYSFILTHCKHTSHEPKRKLPSERVWLCTLGIKICHYND